MRLRSLVPMAFVASVPRSIAFYEKLGLEVGNTHQPDGEPEPVWAWLRSDRAQLMLARASDPIDPTQQAILFYGYCDDVAAFRAELLGKGIDASPVKRPFYAPRGEFRVTDPDGNAVMITHT